MERILLVEPAYKNKYPPIGLMKISTFHKEYRKDYVKFVKGIAEEKCVTGQWDRIYITTLFTFDFDEVVKTVNYYKQFVRNPQSDIIIGGILATLLPKRVFEKTGIKTFEGQVTCASQINYKEFEGVNVDTLSLDYDILSEIDYKYPAGDNYFGYTSRGCPNKCKFCAVPTLEPSFNTTNNILSQINDINNKYGEKRNLLLMDNNILHSPQLEEIVKELKKAGFKKGAPTFIKPVEYINIYNRIKRRRAISSKAYFFEIKKDIVKLKNILIEYSKKVKKNDRDNYTIFINELKEKPNLFKTIEYLDEKNNYIIAVLETMQIKRKLQRYIDFNQGTDARLLTEEKMKILSEIDVRPYRIAFDDIKLKSIYIKAMKIAGKYGVKHFSNYILFNYKDTPEELWERLKINIDLVDELNAKDLFSFPMKYVPIEQTHRKFVGENWSKKYISNIYAILNAKKGIVPKRRDFFEKAFGKTKEEFIELLNYPRDFLMYRSYFEENGFSKKWLDLYRNLSNDEHLELKKFQNGDEAIAFSEPLELLFALEKVKKDKVDLLKQLLFKDKVDFEILYEKSIEVSQKKIILKKDITNFIKNENPIQLTF